ncbi:MAG: FAD-binding protein [Christensenellales bacterium]|jgi:succinate dehydrogenase/fumarate reductase flavoprotein subunit/uncharacterized protein with FMN-binding domain
MKRLTKSLALLLCLAMFFSLAACQSAQVEPESTPAPTEAVEQTGGVSGEFTAAFAGFGGDVAVTLTVANGAVTAFAAEGENETAGIGKEAIEKLNEGLAAFVSQPVADIDVSTLDAVSGATVTSTAVINAAAQAVKMALGEDTAAKTPVKDGDYVVEAIGNSLIKNVKVQVSFANGALSDIQVLDHAETNEIFLTVTEYLIPRLIEHQSLAVDSITGATVSSNAIKDAVAQAIAQAGGTASEWYAPVEKKADTVKLEGYDVIVVGLGGAGVASYLSAAQNGATVFGIEAAAKIGGTTTNVSGPMAINPSIKMQEENNGQKWLEEEDLIEDWLAYTRGDAKEELVRLFVYESGETLDWMMTDFDFKFGPMRAFFHPKGWVVWCNYDAPTRNEYGAEKTPMFQAALDKAKAMNNKNGYELELTATDLITEGDKIVGVRATKYDGTTYEVYGKSVILATGGYIGDDDMCMEYLGSIYNTEAMLQNDGAGIKMAMAVGAATYNIDMPPMVHIAQTKTLIRNDDLDPAGKAVLSAFVLKPDCMFTDPDGQRFMNEQGNIAFDNWKAGGTYYAIYSQAQMDEYKNNGMKIVAGPMFMGQGGVVEAEKPIADLDHILEVGERYGIVVKGDTMEELANKLNAPKLVESAATYTSYAKGAADPFGKAAELISPLEEGPFYAVIGAGYVYGSCGGLDIDENMNVLRTDGTTIENLYAVGQDSMGVLFTNKDAYVTYGGAAQGWVITSGRIAGEKAAEKFAGR